MYWLRRRCIEPLTFLSVEKPRNVVFTRRDQVEAVCISTLIAGETIPPIHCWLSSLLWSGEILAPSMGTRFLGGLRYVLIFDESQNGNRTFFLTQEIRISKLYELKIHT